MTQKRRLAWALALLFVVNIAVISLAQQAEAATYRQGSSGEQVRIIQTKLKNWGYYDGAVDGIYGSQTAQAVKYFQRKNGLTADGIAGPATLKALGMSSGGGGSSSQQNSAALLARVISAEARGEPYSGQVAVGAVILNQDMTVMQTNKAAQEISQIFWEQYRHNQGHFLRSNYQGDPKFREVQTMINEISERLTTQGGTSQTFTSPAGDITFYHTSFLSSSAAGLIQTWHLMLITCQTKDLPKNLNHPYNTLTQQERRIVYYLASGMKNEQIAEELHISIYTVRTHIANIYKKFEVNNKVDLLMHLQPILKDQTTPP